MTNGSLNSPAYCLVTALPACPQGASREGQRLFILSRKLKAETVFRIVVLQVPVHNHHDILKLGADMLKDVFNPTLADF